MTIRRFIVAALLLCFTPSAWSQGWLTGWDYRKPITAPAASVTGGPHANFPLVVDLGDDADISAAAHWSGRDLRVTSSDGTTERDFILAPKGTTLDVDGIRSWFSGGPVYSSTYNKTWISVFSRAGYVKVIEIDHTAGTWSVYAVSSLPEFDDHDDGSLCLLSDGRLLIFYGRHGDDRLRYRISTIAGDASSWGSELHHDPLTTADATYSYSNVYRLSSDGRIYNFFRFGPSGDRDWYYVTSDDDGVNWSAATLFWQGTATPYCRFTSDGVDRIDCLATVAHANENNRLVNHFYLDGAAETWHDSDGSAITLPATFSTASTIYDGTADTAYAWIWDIQYRSDGNPHVVFTVFPDEDNLNHRYYYSRWTGTAWTTPVDVVGADIGDELYTSPDNYYSGGICLDPDFDDTIYLCQEVTGVYELQEWTTADSGSSWAKNEDITSGSAADNFRPRIAPGTSGKEGRVTWNGNGLYDNYLDTFHTCTRAHPAVGSYYEHLIVNVPSLADDTTLYVYYGNAAATDGQSLPSVVYPDDLLNIPGYVPLDQRLSNVGLIGTVTGQFRLLSGIWPEATVGTGVRLNSSTYGRDTDRFGFTSPNLAGKTVISGTAEFQYDDSGGNNEEHVIVAAFDGATKANILIRVEPSTNAIEAFIVSENTLKDVSPTTPAPLTVTANTTYLLNYAIEQTGSGWQGRFRLNKTKATGTATGTAAFDPDATYTLGAAGLASDSAAAIDSLNGFLANVRLIDREVSDDESDTLYDLRDGSALTVGTEESQSGLTAGILSQTARTDTTVTLSWTAATGGTPPYTYDIEVSPAGAGTWTDAATNVTSPYTVTGLTPGTAYDFRLRVTDSAP